MKRKWLAPLLLCLSLLCACGKESTPAPTAAPTPSPCDTVEELTLRGDESEEELSALPLYTRLRRLDATALPCDERLLGIYESVKAGASPDCVVEWTVPLLGQRYSSLSTELDFSGAGLTDTEELRAQLRYFPLLERVNLLESGLTQEQIMPLADAYEDVLFVWELHFSNCRLRTDSRVFSTLRGDSGGMGGISQQELEPLFRYCTELVALDMGHCQLNDLQPLTKLKKLRVLFIADNRITDLSPLAELQELEYLELFLNADAENFSALGALHNMVGINLSYCKKLDNVDFVAGMPKLEQCWVRGCAIPRERREEIAAQYPAVKFNFGSRNVSSTAEGWRSTERNIAYRTMFRNWEYVLDYRDWNDILWQEGIYISEARAEY